MCDDPSSVVWAPDKPGGKVCVRVETEEENCVCSGNYTIDGSTTDIEHDDVYNNDLCPQTDGKSQIDFEVCVRFVNAGGTAQIKATLEREDKDPLEYCHMVTAEADGKELTAYIGVVFP